MIFNRAHSLAIALLTLAAPSLAKDTVILKNGDILSGTLLSENDEHVYFRTEAFGAVSLQTQDIAEIRFETEKHGEIATQPAAAKPEVAVATNPVPEAPSPAEFVGPLPQSELNTEEERNPWSGQAGLSVAMRESVKYNASGVTGTDRNETYRFYGNMGWDAQPNKLIWDWTYRYSRDEYEKQDDYVNITQHYTRDFEEKNYYATAKTMYQQDYRRKIEHEYLQTAEMGIKWIALPDLEFSTSAGGGYHQYNRIAYNDATGMNEELSMSQPKFIFDESLRWQVINSLTLLQKYTHLGDLTNYHFVFTAGLENKLIRDVFLRLEYRLDRDTEVYYDDRGYYDKAVLTSLLYKF